MRADNEYLGRLQRSISNDMRHRNWRHAVRSAHILLKDASTASDPAEVLQLKYTALSSLVDCHRALQEWKEVAYNGHEILKFLEKNHMHHDGNAALIADAYEGIYWAARHERRIEDAQQAGRDQLEYALIAKDSQKVDAAYNNLSYMLRHCEQWAEQQELQYQRYAYADDHNLPAMKHKALVEVSQALRKREQWFDMEAIERERMEIYKETHDIAGKNDVYKGLSLALAGQGKWRELSGISHEYLQFLATPRVQEALGKRPNTVQSDMISTYARLAASYRHQHKWEGAEQVSRASLEALEQAGSERDKLQSELGLMHSLIMRGDWQSLEEMMTGVFKEPDLNAHHRRGTIMRKVSSLMSRHMIGVAQEYEDNAVARYLREEMARGMDEALGDQPAVSPSRRIADVGSADAQRMPDISLPQH